jgi:hypothetical protein
VAPGSGEDFKVSLGVAFQPSHNSWDLLAALCDKAVDQILAPRF